MNDTVGSIAYLEAKYRAAYEAAVERAETAEARAQARLDQLRLENEALRLALAAAKIEAARGQLRGQEAER